MRVESSVLSVSWIPSEMLPGLAALPFDRGLLHYDEPPPERIIDLEALRAGDRFRFANELTGWITVEDGRITGYGQGGRGHIGVTRVRLAGRELSFAAVGFPELRPDPVVGEDRVVLTQTYGGRTGVPAPRPVPLKPFVQWAAPTVWTTLTLTLHADGHAEGKLAGASSMPRHWLYDHERRLVAKTSVVDMTTWARTSFGGHTPWGAHDSPALVSVAESALERQLAHTIMRGGERPEVRRLPEGMVVVRQGHPGRERYLLLDGILTVEVDGETVAEVGPGAVVGERALLEGGIRTATLRTATPCRIAVASEDRIDRQALAELSSHHRREEQPDPPAPPAP
ncbi:MAG TPA: cyclic nucleotide-binding domain-containing protein [Egibacteraceae bacterium]|nr:cyclic nucleotide-binding domain-containing protein [Egibacteraceae bacterium]